MQKTAAKFPTWLISHLGKLEEKRIGKWVHYKTTAPLLDRYKHIARNIEKSRIFQREKKISRGNSRTGSVSFFTLINGLID